MSHLSNTVRVLYSFPGKLGGGRIGCTSWQQVSGLAMAGAEVLAFPGVLQTSLPANVSVRPTLSYGRARISYKLFGTLRAYAIHDRIVAHRLEELRNQIDIVHTWPLGALRTLATAARLGIATVYERTNAHTRVFYEAVQKECTQLGLRLASSHEHNWNDEVLQMEEQEYAAAARILCPSQHVADTFLAHGFAPERLARHRYGYDPGVFYPLVSRDVDGPLTALFVGGLSPVKGLHYALPAWLQSSACRTGRFLVVGEPTPEYMATLAPFLNHQSIHLLGHRNDVPELMRNSDVLVLSSISEGCPLVCNEAIGSGCIPLVSDRIDVCDHMRNGLVHPVGNIDVLAQHISVVNENRELLRRLRAECLKTAPRITWKAAGERLLEVYLDVIEANRPQPTSIRSLVSSPA